MAKPMVVTLPFVMLLLDYWPLNRIRSSEFGIRNFAKLLFEKLPFLALSAASCVITFLAQHHGGAVASLKDVSLHYRLENVPVAYARYLLKLFWPSRWPFFIRCNPSPAGRRGRGCGFDFHFRPPSGLRAAGPYWLVGWLWFLGTLLPVIGLVQVGGAAMADRYAYFPSIGLFLAVALGIRDGVERFHFSKGVVGGGRRLVLASCLVLTHRQLDFGRMTRRCSAMPSPSPGTTKCASQSGVCAGKDRPENRGA